MSLPISHSFIRPLKKDEIGHVMFPSRAKYSWLNTKNRQAIMNAVDSESSSVKLEGLSWSEFSITYYIENGHKDKIYISPTGTGSPYTPAIWLSVTKLRKELAQG